MSINDIVMALIALFMILGLLDYICKNRFGLGEAFKEGIMAMGSLALVMVGIVSLSPVLAKLLIPVISPLYNAIGADPASFANTILAVDMGGYSLAQVMAQSTEAGQFSWVLLGTMLGTTVVFTIPVALGILHKEDHPFFAKGVLIGISTIPIGCFTGGLAAGFEVQMMLKNLLIPILLSLLIILGLRFYANTTVKLLKGFGAGVSTMSLIGLGAAGVSKLLGVDIIPGMEPLSTGIETVGTIAIVLAGAFPMVAVITKVLKGPLEKAGRLLGIDSYALTGMVASLAHSIPAFQLVKDMTPRGKVICIAFSVSGSFVLGGHLGFVAGTDKNMVAAMIIGKLTGGITAALIASLSMRERNKVIN